MQYSILRELNSSFEKKKEEGDASPKKGSEGV